MSIDSPDLPETVIRRPRGWVLCLLYALTVSPLMAGAVLLVDALSGPLGLESGIPGQLLVALAKVVLIYVTMVVAFSLFRRLYALEPPRLTEPQPMSRSLALIGWLVAIFVLSLTLVMIVSGSPGRGKGVDGLGNLIVLGWLTFMVGHTPLATFLNQDRTQPEEPDGGTGGREGS